jgi:hypothetical protein
VQGHAVVALDAEDGVQVVGTRTGLRAVVFSVPDNRSPSGPVAA